MKDRCYNSKCDAYKNYGAKGVKICDEWLENFNNFRDWALSNGYDNNLTIDRIDENGCYTPENCRWITLAENVACANYTCQRRYADRGRYYGIDENGIRYEFENASLFAREHDNLKASRIREYANRDDKRKKYNGWEFGFCNDYE